MVFALEFFLIHIPEALVLFIIGLSTFGLSIRQHPQKLLMSGLIYAIPGLILSFYEVSIPLKMAVLYTCMMLLLMFLCRMSAGLSIGISVSAFVIFYMIQFFIIWVISSMPIHVISSSPSHVVSISIAWLNMAAVLGVSWIMQRSGFNIRSFFPKSVHNRYLSVIVLFGSIELLSILLLNTIYIIELTNTKLPSGIILQLPLFQLVVLVLFILIIFLLRVYLNLTVNRVETETQTPYLQNITDLLTAIRSIKHDAVNHYTAINGLVQFGSHELATEYVKQLISEASNIITVVEGVKNPAVSALLHSKMAICIANRVPLSISVKSTSQFQFIKSTDLVTILGNLLDNAIRSALNEAEEDRFIRIEWLDHPKGSILMLEYVGPSPLPVIPSQEPEQPEIPSVSEGTTGGITIAKKFVDRYKGSFHISSDSERTSITIDFS